MTRPLHDWILVDLDPLVTEEGGLLLPLGSTIRTGTVASHGPGRWNAVGVQQPVGLKPGERVAFRREHLEHLQGKQMMLVLDGRKGTHEEELTQALIRAPDVLFVFEGDSPRISA